MAKTITYIDVVSKMNTGGKYDSKAFKKSVGLNGVGTKAVNALSNYFRVESGLSIDIYRYISRLSERVGFSGHCARLLLQRSKFKSR